MNLKWKVPVSSWTAFLLFAMFLASNQLVEISRATPQGNTATTTVSGSVVDFSGASVGRAIVELHSKTTNWNEKVTTEENGEFHFSNVPYGGYALSCNVKGFRAWSQDIEISSRTLQSVQIVLKLAPISTQIEVATSAPKTYTVDSSVTATRMDVPILDIPHSIQVVSSQLLEDRQTTRVADAGEVVAGVTRAIGYSEYGDRYNIRGFLIDYSLRDGFKNNDWVSLSDVSSVERVDILKGPAGILYGKIEPGGVVNVTTKKPLEDLHYTVESVFDTFGSYRPSLDLNMPLKADKTLLFRVNGAFEDAKSLRPFVHSKTPFLAPALSWDINKRLKLTLQGEFLRLRGVPDDGFSADLQSFKLPVSRTLGDPSDFYQDENHRYSHSLSYLLTNDWIFLHAFSILDMNSTRGSIHFPLAGLAIAGNAATLVDANGNALRDWHQLGIAARDYATHNDFIGQFRTGPIKHKIVVGFELTKDPMTITWDYAFGVNAIEPLLQSPFIPAQQKQQLVSSFLVPELNVYTGQLYCPPSITAYGACKLGSSIHVGGIANDPVGAHNKYYQTENGGAGYAQDLVTLSRQWKMFAGVRYDGAESIRTQLGISNNGTVENSFRHFSPHGGLMFQPTSSISVYGSYSESFTYLPFNPLYLQLTLPGGPNKPTHGIQYEGGVKFKFGTLLQATMSYFYLTKDNLINLAAIASGNTAQAQDVTQLSRGVELDMTTQITKNWNSITSLSYNSNCYLKSPCYASGAIPLFNDPLYTGNFWTTYRLNFGHVPHLVFGGGANYVDSRVFQPSFPGAIPPFTRIDAMIAYELKEGRWRFQANVKDLTNHRYYETNATDEALYPYSRLIQVSAKYHF